MPELAEVAFYSKAWAPGIGNEVVEVFCRDQARIYRAADPAKIRRGLKGKKLTGIETKGKQMRFVFEASSLGLHLGMTGELLVKGREDKPGKHDHLVIRQAKHSLVFRDSRMFGALKFAMGREPDWWTKLPPEVVSRAFTLQAVSEYLRRRKGSPIKAVLLQQERFPGVGNWMADEILWRCRFYPGRRAGILNKEETEMFWRETRHLCRDALRIIGTNYGNPPTSWLFRHRWRPGGKCPRDGTTLERATIGGRTTAWCPNCQRK
ncbi:MAG: DNA-formamidopyrimidine glycosylase family protein [Chthoniobacterales bacterium]|jgi:formamidopyrimidine-DNA glycosylase